MFMLFMEYKEEPHCIFSGEDNLLSDEFTINEFIDFFRETHEGDQSVNVVMGTNPDGEEVEIPRSYFMNKEIIKKVL